MSASDSSPFGFMPSITPRIPLPCSVSATTTSRGFAVAQKIWQTSGTLLIAFRIFTGKPPSIIIIKTWPHPRAIAFRFARSRSRSSLPTERTSAGPDLPVHLALERVQAFVLEEEHGIVIADRGLQQRLGIRRRRGADDLEARYAHEPGDGHL